MVPAEAVPLPTIITDATGSDIPIIFANESFLELTGYLEKAIIGRPVADVVNTATDQVTRSAVLAAIAEGSAGHWELRLCGREAKEFLAVVYVSPIHDRNGALIHTVLSLAPIESHDDGLTKQRNDLYALYQQAPGFIAMSRGPKHRFTFANASYKRFVGRDDLEGRTVAEAMPEIAGQGFVAILDRVFATGEPFIARNVGFDFVQETTGDRERRYAHFIYHPVRAADGEITGLFCEGYDITAQHENARQLAELQSEFIQVARANAMGTMAITLAHELNQPLGAIANYAQGAGRMVAPDGPDAEALSSALVLISDAAHRASAILRNLRDLTSGRTTSRTVFNLKDAVAECIRLVGAVAPQSVNFFDTTPEAVVVCADRVQIQQVLINLLRNASEAVQLESHQEVLVTASQSEGSVVVGVSDTGSGVPCDAAASLFSFVHSTKAEGMGIGLSICRTIIEAHGGKIWLERSTTAGTEFRFSLPREATTHV